MSPCAIVGAEGVPGTSVSSVTVTVIVCVAVNSRVPVPLVASTTTIYSLLPDAFTGSALTTSHWMLKVRRSLESQRTGLVIDLKL